ncbi:class I SAM-dependent methyltransferase [Salininema proteolyticum]|uniref:Class I SAM-dependent methyltransferase n=1 Tax=Salininema proteolyticum TaxID=1607685 RepID=A0ABV8U5J9_9ACTN
MAVENTTGGPYEPLAEVYEEYTQDILLGQPFDRAMMAAFAELVGDGTVLDAGCGPGYATDHLSGLGVTAKGVDQSPEMIRLATKAYPELDFSVGDIADLDEEDGALAGVLARYSTIHMEPEDVALAVREFHRVTIEGGYVLISFQSDTEGTVPTAFDHRVAQAYRWPVDAMAELLRSEGFAETARLIRVPKEDERGFPQAHLLVCKEG